MPISLVFQGKCTETFQEVPPPQNSVPALRWTLYGPPPLVVPGLASCLYLNLFLGFHRYFEKIKRFSESPEGQPFATCFQTLLSTRRLLCSAVVLALLQRKRFLHMEVSNELIRQMENMSQGETATVE